MYNLLVKLMVLAAILHLGMSLSDFQHCHSGQCAQTIEMRSRDVLKVDWKPISLFPNEARRFQ